MTTPLDDILHFVQNAPGKNLARIDAKAAIKSLMLDVVQSIGDRPMKGLSGKYVRGAIAELRKKVEDL